MKITHADRKDIVVALQSGSGTAAELGNTYGVTAGRIAVIYREETGSYLRPLSKPPRRLSHDEKEAIVAAIQAKKATMTELAQRYEVTIPTIGYVFKKAIGRSLQPQLSQQDQEAIVAELQSGNITIQDLAARYHVSPQTIGRNFKRATGKAFIPKFSRQDDEAIVTELRSGKATLKELTVRYGVHRGTIGRRFKQLTGKSLHIRNWKLSQQDREAIVAALKAKETTMTTLAAKYGTDQTTISHLFKDMTGISFSQYKKTVEANKQFASKGKIKHKIKKELHDVDALEQLLTNYAKKYPHAKITYSFVDHTITVEKA